MIAEKAWQNTFNKQGGDDNVARQWITRKSNPSLSIFTLYLESADKQMSQAVCALRFLRVKDKKNTNWSDTSLEKQRSKLKDIHWHVANSQIPRFGY